ncbi:MAG: hypothetical protein ABI939_01480 [Anaerolineaceae bacterium]
MPSRNAEGRHGVRSFAATHAKISAEVEESGSLLAFAGWLIPFNAPIVLESYDRTRAERVAAGHFRIGFEDVLGFLPWGDSGCWVGYRGWWARRYPSAQADSERRWQQACSRSPGTTLSRCWMAASRTSSKRRRWAGRHRKETPDQLRFQRSITR